MMMTVTMTVRPKQHGEEDDDGIGDHDGYDGDLMVWIMIVVVMMLIVIAIIKNADDNVPNDYGDKGN